MMTMTARMLVWFWRKAEQYQLSCEAMSLWLDFYSYLQEQEQNGTIQNDRIKCTVVQHNGMDFEQLLSFSELDRAMFWQLCMELTRAGMMEFVVEDSVLRCSMSVDEQLPIGQDAAV